MLDVSGLSADELRELKAQLDQRLVEVEAREFEGKLVRLEALVAELGLRREDVAARFGGGKKAARKPVAPKFRDPNNPERKWSGRGRKPRWFMDQIAAGKTPEDLAI